MSVPVVDFSACSLARCGGSGEPNQAPDPDPEPEPELRLMAELREAFTQVGFVFLKNTGISQEEVDRVMETALRFFQQPEEVKRAASKGSFAQNQNHGWASLEAERLNPQRPGDLKETYNMCVLALDAVPWEASSGPLSDLQDSHAGFFLRCAELSRQVLGLMARGLDLDPQLFLNAHRLVGSSGNGTTLRSLYYPPVDSGRSKQNQLRCGEHSDYGSITLLFQGSEGLQVRSRSGGYVDIPVVPGAVLVNIGDLMQRWTNERFVSSLHRVLLPPAGDPSTRQSLAFFMHPDDHALITCDKHPPIQAGAYLQLRLDETYGRS